MKADLNNPMRFSVRNRTVDVANVLDDDRRVTQIEVQDGQLYVHWEEVNG